MSFPAYPEYKHSGVEWLGAVPEHWSLHKLKYIARFSGGGTPSRENLAYWNGDIPWVSPKDMKVQVIVGAEENITVAGLRNSTTSLVPPGGVIIVVRSGILKHTVPVAINNVEVALNQDMKALRFNPKLACPEFFLRWVQGFNNRLLNAWLKQGATVESIEQEYLADTIVPMPDIDEQKMIIGFLDHEISRIDTLIEEQQRLIEVLKEKRQAVISHAVTKGLEPTMPMKDSGVEWLGEVPAHWGVKALRYLGECQNGINIGGESFGSGSPFVSYGDVYKNDVLPTEVAGLVQSSPEDQQRYSIEYGDVFFTRTSETVDEIGFSATCLQELPSAVFAGFLIRFRPTGKSLYPGFSKYYFRNQGLRIFFSKEMNLVTRASLGQDLLKLLPVTIPPLVEQIKISDYLDRVTAEFGSLLGQCIKAIDLLKERRSALISAAVTGKIDVRGWQPLARAQSPELEEEAV